MNKADWRKKALSLRDALTEEERANKSALITKGLLESDAYAAAGVVACYVSFGSEVDTVQILQAALQDGKMLFCPRMIRHNPPGMEFFRVTGLSQLQPGYAGIMEPDARLCNESLKDHIHTKLRDASVLMIMPGVVFSKQRDRIGYGGGCYDQYLREMHASGFDRMITAAVAFDCQVFESLTGMEKHDIRPDMLFLSDSSRPARQAKNPKQEIEPGTLD